ncbi:hypothetical protein MYX76_14150 [Desulfobacterota bacterium AH_259_B03_O07]|nr:hypothetical protein [Desulfobacterota bacterium AH_259_B03_O07]
MDRGEPAPPSLRTPPPLSDLEAKNSFDDLYEEFLRNRTYDFELYWNRDLNWRMTGPYVGSIGMGEFFGVHSSAVRIYYSPEIINWLCNNREGPIPDGAMIIKEQHPIDESLGIVTDSEGCIDITASVSPTAWTIFIKNNQASNDGWYQGSFRADPGSGESGLLPLIPEWQVGNPPIVNSSGITSEVDFFAGGTNPPTERNPDWYPTGYLFVSDEKLPDTVWPYNQYGNWCINCHASAVSESTFSSLVNVITAGTKFKQFDPDLALLEDPNFDGILHIPQRVALFFLESEFEDEFISPFTDPLPEPTHLFLDFYDQIPPVPFSRAWEVRLPGETYDHQVSFAEGPDQFLTSDQCIGCHDATFFNFFLPNMILTEEQPDGTTTRYNLSPYAEWKASPLGQAGRDPIFFAQVESETNFFAETGLANLSDPKICIETTCLHCHGVMGQRQLQIDTQGQDDEGCASLFGIAPPPEVPIGKPLSASAVTEWPGAENNSLQRYGALARDGISCTVCHHIVDEGFGEEAIYTGNFVTGPPDEIYGPYKQVIVKPMENSLGINPEFGSQTLSSDLCGTCHNILLPIVTNQGELLGFSYEQTTHLEWLNSVFAPGRSESQTCQDCHMPTTFHGKDLEFKIANIESNELPPSPNRLPNNEITLRERSRYARHTLHGLNVFLNEMFQEFPLILGIRQIDFMSGIATVPPLTAARDSFLDLAENKTAAVTVKSLEITPEGKLKSVVRIDNKAGHYLPSGVSFRRVFIEFLVKDVEGNILWASGRTNSLGAIIEGVDGPVLPSELLLENPQAFQPHYQQIDSEDQVQIYQELVADSDGNLTSSFLRRVFTIKNNRIRPKGFDPEFFFSNPSPFIRELAEIPGDAKFDPYYTDPSLTGADEIEYLVTLDQATLAKVANVTVTLYNQSIPPFYLQQRFFDANIGPAENENIDRLYYLTSHLNTEMARDNDGVAFIKDWKLMLATDTMDLE